MKARHLLEGIGRKLLGPACAGVVGGILVACLWPFHSPRNHVAWLAGEDGLRFSHPGTVVSAGDFISDPLDSGCSVEFWMQPERRRDSNTFLAFHTAANPLQLAIEQSDTDLKLQRAVAGGPPLGRDEYLYAADAFRRTGPLFLTISSGRLGTAVYLDGVLIRLGRRFRMEAADCAGSFVVGTSTAGNAAWTGWLRGLAIYHRELSSPEAVRNYRTWTAWGRPELVGDERCVALYLFGERSGNLVHSQVAGGPNLRIPERYQILDQAFLMPFWKELNLPDIVENIIGFVPFGFLFYAWFSLRPSARRTGPIVVLLGALFSVAIEVLQARLPTRQSDSTDILSNTFGTWIGVMLYRYFRGTFSIRTDDTRQAG